MRVRIFSFLLVISLFLPNGLVAAQNQTDYPSYEIRPGDSLGLIANLFGTTIEEITQLNNIDNPDLISPGQKILIPGYSGFKGTLQFISTDLGETFSLLPIKYHVEHASILRFNPLLSPASIFAGSELILLIPEEAMPLLPVAIVESAQTGLETAGRLTVNPQMQMIQNELNGSSHYLPGKVIFANDDGTKTNLDLFSPPLKEVSISPLPLVQGGTQVISVVSDQPISLSGSLGDKPLEFFSSEPGSYYALQGVHALQDPGLLDFNINVSFSDGSVESFTQPVLVTPGFFDVDPPLNVDPSTIDPSVTGPENELVYFLISKISPTRHWETIFSSPAYYQEYNSLYGTRRRYNDDPIIYFHTGVDFAGGMTLPITSPAPGVVVFAGPLTVRGNAVFIDHGWGVFSGFFHQDTILVNVGDFVETGQQIGTVGNTGRVNGAGDYQGAGAHLHWELWVNGVQINPLDWLTYQYP